MTYDLILQNGLVVSASDTFLSDVAVKDGRIAALGRDLSLDGAKTVDCRGKLVLPGGIDVHTHLEMPFGGTTSKDTFETGTIAAACGGTTSIVDFCIQGKGQSLRQALDGWHAKADGKACIDYGFHVAVTDMTDGVLAEMPGIIESGYPSFKVFMVYDMRVSDSVFLQTLEVARDNGGLVCVHAENNDVVLHNVATLLAEGKTAPRYHALSRPPLVEGEAVGRACKLAAMTGGPLYIVHLSCEDSLQEVRRAREAGVNVMAETCPQYLYLSTDNYEESGFDGAKYVMSPPLRPKENIAPLWAGLAGNDLQTVATDHCPFDMEGQKELGRDDFSKIPNGAPGIESRMSLLYKGVRDGRISLNRMVALGSTNPAKAMGMFPAKGVVAPGSDADICVFDPAKAGPITHAELHENVDYAAFEGVDVPGRPVLTLSRGEIVARDGEWIGQKGRGRFIRRGRPESL